MDHKIVLFSYIDRVTVDVDMLRTGCQRYVKRMLYSNLRCQIFGICDIARMQRSRKSNVVSKGADLRDLDIHLRTR